MTRIVSIDPGRRNLGLCLLESTDDDPMHDRIVIWKLLNTPPDAGGLAACLNEVLDGVPYDRAVLERQPPKNAAMKRTEHMLEMYFAMRGTPVSILDAKRKLAFALKTPLWNGAQNKESWSYIQRKKLAVTIATRFLEMTQQPDESVTAFRTAPKKDDLADCLLQAQAYAHQPEGSEASLLPAFPTPRPPKKGSSRLTKSNIAYLCYECANEDEIERALKTLQPKPRKLFATFFGTPARYLESRARHLRRLEDLEHGRNHATLANNGPTTEETRDRPGI